MTVEQRLTKLETMIAEIHAVVTGRERIDGIDMPAYRRAIRELARGNSKPLDIYMRRGGQIPVRGEKEGEA